MNIRGEKRIQTFTNEYGLTDTWTYIGNILVKAEYSYPKLTKTKTDMTEKETLFKQIDAAYQLFVASHNGKTKKSQSSARKYLGEIKKLVTAYRKASVEEGK